MDQQAIATSPTISSVVAWPRLTVGRRAIPYLVIAALLVVLAVLVINFASIVAERNDYLELIRVYGLGGQP